MTTRDEAAPATAGMIAVYLERQDHLKAMHMAAARDVDICAVQLSLKIFHAQQTGLALGARKGAVNDEKAFDEKRTANRMIEAVTKYLNSAFSTGMLLPESGVTEGEQKLLDLTVHGFLNRLSAEAAAERLRQLGYAARCEEGPRGGFFAVIEESAGGNA